MEPLSDEEILRTWHRASHRQLSRADRLAEAVLAVLAFAQLIALVHPILRAIGG